MAISRLQEWLHCATPDERAQLAQLAGTSVSYLYQLAGLHKQQPLVNLALAIEDGTLLIHHQTKGRTPIVTARDLAVAYAGREFPSDGE